MRVGRLIEWASLNKYCSALAPKTIPNEAPMLRLLGPGARLCDGWTRREILRVGGLGLLGAGLNLADLARARSAGPGATRRSAGRSRASSCS